jgi:hypothetical protein
MQLAHDDARMRSVTQVRPRVSYAELERWPDDGRRFEFCWPGTRFASTGWSIRSSTRSNATSIDRGLLTLVSVIDRSGTLESPFFPGLSVRAAGVFAD